MDDRNDYRRAAFGTSRRFSLSFKLGLLPRHFFVSHRRKAMRLILSNLVPGRIDARLGATECYRALLRRWRIAGAMSRGLKLSVGMRCLRFSMASQSAKATSFGMSARTTIGQPLKSTVATSAGMPLKRDFGTTEVR